MDVGYLGEAWHFGTVILAWDAVLTGGRDTHDGKNVVLHEFAHQLDYLDGVADGTPPLRNRAQYRRWQEVMTAEFARLAAESEHGRPRVLDAYGATNPAEFFAVATECFFEKPMQLRRHHPQLYDILKEYYCQDTGLRFAAEGQPAEAPVDARTYWWAAEGQRRRRSPYRGSRKRPRPAARAAVAFDWPRWVTVWGIEPDWQRWQAQRYLDNHLIGLSALAVCFGLAYLIRGWRWTAGTILCLALCALLCVTAVWLYVVIRWIDRHQGWAEQQAPKGASPPPTAAAPEPAPQDEPATSGADGAAAAERPRE
jgi:hypothetical protein